MELHAEEPAQHLRGGGLAVVAHCPDVEIADDIRRVARRVIRPERLKSSSSSSLGKAVAGKVAAAVKGLR